MKKLKHQLNVALACNAGSVLAIPMRVYDDKQDALLNAKKLESELKELLKDASLCVRHVDPQTKQVGMVEVMTLADFLSNFLRASAVRPLVTELIHDDGAPELLAPSAEQSRIILQKG